ncbi:MAG: SDR family NAD(P)-dependent oxidoreductase [Acidobacteriaceae bacterium]
MLNPMSLQGQTIVITGGAQGIGKAVADLAYDLGASLVLIDIQIEQLQKTAAYYRDDRILKCAGSVSDVEFVNDAMRRGAERFGNLHGLVNSAGIIKPAMIEKMSGDQWSQVIDVNLTGSYYCVQAFGRIALEKVKSGDKTPRSIVNISSDAGRMGTIGQINYSAAKSGMFGITMSTAREWARYGIRSNAICFGVVETAMTATVRGEKFREALLARIPMSRWSSVEEAARPICFFLSEASSYITGQIISADGGGFMSA